MLPNIVKKTPIYCKNFRKKKFLYVKKKQFVLGDKGGLLLFDEEKYCIIKVLKSVPRFQWSTEVCWIRQLCNLHKMSI